MKAKLLSYWKPLAAVTFWGISFIATKIALDELAPLSIIFLRLILASILLSILAVYSNKKLDLSWKNHGSIFILALIAAFHLWIQVTGMQYTTAANTGWIIGTAPIFMAIVGYIAFKESLSPMRIFGILLAFFGLLLLISKGDFSSIDLLSNKGDFLILASAFTWSIYSAVNKKISLTYSPLLTVLFLFLMMAVIISPFSISSQSIQSVIALSTKSWIAILFLGVFCSGVAYVLWAQALKEMDSVRVGAFLYFEPFVTVFAAWLILSEEITFLMIVSGVVITLGVLLVNFNLRELFRSNKSLV